MNISKNNIIPNAYFIVSGAGSGSSELNAFDFALLDSGLGNLNLVRMSSILPPSAAKIEPYKISYGSLVPVAYAYQVSNRIGETISAAIAIAFPTDKTLPGLIMEYSGLNKSADFAEKRAVKMATEGIRGRGWNVDHVESISRQMTVDKDFAAVFAAVTLCYI